MNALIALGLGIIVFSLIIGVGVVVLSNFGGTVAQCPALYNTAPGGYNLTIETCMNQSGSTTNTSLPTNTAYTSTTTMRGYLSTNLVTWIPAIIALSVGLLFIGALMGRKGTKM